MSVLSLLLFPLARRFIAGNTVEDALAAARTLHARGFASILDFLGEHVRRAEDAKTAARAYEALVERLAADGLDAMIAFKPTHLGLELGEAFCLGLLETVTGRAVLRGIRVGIDMEDSSTTDASLAAYRRLNGKFPGNVQIALQARLKRSAADLSGLIAEGASVRLVKGAYKEPATIAYTRTREIRKNFLDLLERLLREGRDTAVATHDAVLLREAKERVRRLNAPREKVEFQMLLGIRPDLQHRLLAEGHRVRIYVPFGAKWLPYTLRRVRERPWYLWLALRSILHPRPYRRTISSPAR